ncbi:aldehyde dehydrogenase family protein [Brevibacillus sp. NRS-1366]|uniref:aldehyde dehydrogenase family protein n=1 Tax=Brevibacillus sp. NRS-1366 TaxID=3233899 RepID=UPI003D224C51
MKTHEVAVREYKQLINGEWTASSSGETIERRSPATGEVVAKFFLGTIEDTQQAIAAARTAFGNGPWPRMSGAERGRILHRLAQLVRENLERLALIEAQEVGKPIKEARGEMEMCISLIEYAASMSQQIYGQSYSNLGAKRTAMVVKEPVGVVGIITAWNFPAVVLCQKLPFALATGCTTVVKPSEFTSGTTLEISRLAQEAGVPDGVINVVTGYGDVVGQSMIDSPEIDRISFTGSTATGKKVLARSAQYIRKVTMELGGKSAMIVFEDADLEDALDGAMLGFMLNQGEECVSNSRLLIHEKIADDFLEKLVEKVKKIKVGNPLSEDTDMGALIHEDHVNKVLAYIESAKQAGARLLTGGNRLIGGEHQNGCFVEPTIFDQVDQNMKVFQEEIFGPVLSVTRFQNLEEAISLANSVDYGLGNSVWTKDIDKAMTVSRALRSGSVWVNTLIDIVPELPAGGYKASGFGRELGTFSIDEFMEVKTINIHTGKRTPYYNV